MSTNKAKTLDEACQELNEAWDEFVYCIIVEMTPMLDALTRFLKGIGLA